MSLSDIDNESLYDDMAGPWDNIVDQYVYEEEELNDNFEQQIDEIFDETWRSLSVVLIIWI